VLSDTGFVLSKGDLESWRSASHLAAALGYSTNTTLAGLKVFYADDIPVSERSKYNLILVGHPSQLPILKELSKDLPAPFSGGGDIPADLNFQITYRISPESSWGYVELMESPWNANNVIVAFLGNGAQGVSWAVSSVLDPNLSWQVVGNLAVVNDRQIVATDTRLRSTMDTGAASVSANPSSPANPISPTPTGNQNQGWVLPVLIITFLLIVAILVSVISRNRPRGKQRRNIG
jgi:hypothetical protein